MAANPGSTSSGGSASKKGKQMLLDDALRLRIANILHADLQDPESKYSKALEPPLTHGRPEAMKHLADFLNESQHPSCIGRATIPRTLTEWNDKLKEVGKTENERQINDSNAGRNSEQKFFIRMSLLGLILSSFSATERRKLSKLRGTLLFPIT
jgi:hypothetical protein